MADSSTSIIQVKDISKSFRVGEQDIPVLKNVSFTVNQGDFLVIIGPSGCGKSTMLHIILGLEDPTSGQIVFDDYNLYGGTSEDERSEFRKTHVGMVYQQANWIRSLSVKENVVFPLLLMNQEETAANQQALAKLKLVDMQDWADYIPTELSGGQQQRVALSRALVNDPEVIIADEPTGNLDFEAGQSLMQLLQTFNQQYKKTVIMVTHDLEYLKYAKRALRFFDGQIAEEIKDPSRYSQDSNYRSKRNSEAKVTQTKPLEEEQVVNEHQVEQNQDQQSKDKQSRAHQEPAVRVEDL